MPHYVVTYYNKHSGYLHSRIDIRNVPDYREAVNQANARFVELHGYGTGADEFRVFTEREDGVSREEEDDIARLAEEETEVQRRIAEEAAKQAELDRRVAEGLAKLQQQQQNEKGGEE